MTPLPHEADRPIFRTPRANRSGCAPMFSYQSNTSLLLGVSRGKEVSRYFSLSRRFDVAIISPWMKHDRSIVQDAGSPSGRFSVNFAQRAGSQGTPRRKPPRIPRPSIAKPPRFWPWRVKDITTTNWMPNRPQDLISKASIVPMAAFAVSKSFLFSPDKPPPESKTPLSILNGAAKSHCIYGDWSGP